MTDFRGKLSDLRVARRPGMGSVILAGAGPGDPGLLTLKSARALQNADVVLYDRLVNPEILAFAPQAVLIPVGKKRSTKRKSCKSQQDRIIRFLIRYAKLGQKVVRLKGGDPFIFGRGSEEAIALHEAGIPFEVIPGVSSVQGASAAAGIPLTHRGISQGFAVFTAHEAENLSGPMALPFDSLVNMPTCVFLMGVEKLPIIVSGLLDAGRGPNTPVAIVERGTTSRQKVYEGTLENILARSRGASSPALIVVGEVVSLREVIASAAASADSFTEGAFASGPAQA